MGLAVASYCGCQSTIATDEVTAHATMITLLANNPQYQLRKEVEQTVHGILYRVEVSTGPNTRDLAIRLRTEQGDWGVYSEGISDTVLNQIIDRPISLNAKWIDQSAEGFAIEVWVGTVRLK